MWLKMICRLEELTVIDIQFLHGCTTPTLILIHQASQFIKGDASPLFLNLLLNINLVDFNCYHLMTVYNQSFVLQTGSTWSPCQNI